MNSNIDCASTPSLIAVRTTLDKLQEFLHCELARVHGISNVNEEDIVVDQFGVHIPQYWHLSNGTVIETHWTGEDAGVQIHVGRQLALDLSRALHRASKLLSDLLPVAATARRLADSIDIDMIGPEAPVILVLKRYIAEISEIGRNVDVVAAIRIDVQSGMREGTADPSEEPTAIEYRSQPSLARSAGRLAAFATRFLALPYRARYSEEFEGELWALAESGAGWWQQIGHAQRLLFRARRLRVELRQPNVGKAAQ